MQNILFNQFVPLFALVFTITWMLTPTWIKIAKRGMILAHWVYVIGFIAVGVVGEELLVFIGSNADFPSHLLWILLGVGYFSERYGAMHLQLYSITNHIIWHKINGITGFFIVFCTFFLFNIGVNDTYFAWAIFLANVFVFLPLALGTSYKKFKLII